MEADSTTYDSSSKCENSEHAICFPFAINTGNFALYKNFITNNGETSLESQIVERLQDFGLLPTTVKCPTSNSNCKVVCKMARVIDRVQWTCESCGKRQPIRIGSFFFKMQCSIQQVLQMTLAWCEDADLNIAAKHFDVKLKVASSIYDRLDELAIRELKKLKLGGENNVVLAEMYPDCLNRLSPDTTDQSHVHRILMLADTKHIPTFYRLIVIKGDANRLEAGSDEDQILKSEVETILEDVTDPQSMVVLGNNVPNIKGCTTYQHLVQHCDVDMQHFLSSRIWRQALTLCAASRDLCDDAAPLCAASVQRYLDTSAYRLRYGDGFYERVLGIVCAEFTDNRDQ
ncbi:unnamed protein product, partial [Iphiclides podalirius]